MEALKWLFLNPFYYQKMAEISFSVSIHLYFPLIPILLPFLRQKVDRYVTFFHLAVLSVHPTVIQAFIPASFAFTWPATDYFSAKVTGCVQSANPVPPKVPAGNLPLRTKRISAVRFAFMSFGPLIGQKNNPVAGRGNGYIREIKEIQSSTIKNKNVWKLKTFRP